MTVTVEALGSFLLGGVFLSSRVVVVSFLSVVVVSPRGGLAGLVDVLIVSLEPEFVFGSLVLTATLGLVVSLSFVLVLVGVFFFVGLGSSSFLALFFSIQIYILNVPLKISFATPTT